MRPDDLPHLCRIFHDAVHEGAAADYDAAQRRAWAPAVPDAAHWADRLAYQTVIVAEAEGAVAGFMTLRADGYLDLAFVAPGLAGQGIGSHLLAAIEAEASRRGLDLLTVQASLSARPLFERRGWRMVRAQTVHPNGVALTNFAMEKRVASR